ncbi:hypothetical protein JCM10908_004712 [Rhodotorula pacifica]|uniref:uncharacterized protein n=1 Tax=Rhodotorula pacifica TaxID=1495444 RepID=UPI00317C0D20
MTTPNAELIQQWTAEQIRQASLAEFSDEATCLPFQLPGISPVNVFDSATGAELHHEPVEELSFEGLHTVAGLDISFRNAAGEEGVAVLSVLSFPELKILMTLSRVVDLSGTPYVHSYLSFREADIYVSLLEELRSRSGEDERLPQVLFVDGNGRWHPRQAGSAVAVGVKTGLPTVGVAKEFHPLHAPSAPPPVSLNPPSPPDAAPSLLRLPNDYLTSQKGMRRACQAVLREQGDWLALPAPAPAEYGATGSTERRATPPLEYWGAAVLSSPVKGALNSIFVSPGHRLSLTTCVRLALACTRNGKIPEPIRSADLFGRQEVKRIWPG